MFQLPRRVYSGDDRKEFPVSSVERGAKHRSYMVKLKLEWKGSYQVPPQRIKIDIATDAPKRTFGINESYDMAIQAPKKLKPSKDPSRLQAENNYTVIFASSRTRQIVT
jgi:hypothetical protein